MTHRIAEVKEGVTEGLFDAPDGDGELTFCRVSIDFTAPGQLAIGFKFKGDFLESAVAEQPEVARIIADSMSYQSARIIQMLEQKKKGDAGEAN